jgi:hypothetical protein
MHFPSLEELDFSAESLAVSQVGDALKVLDDHYDEIARVGGISRPQAQSLVAECGAQFGNRYPLESFSQIPSTTNLSVAMEGIIEAGGKLLMDLLRRAAALLMQIIRWCIDLVKAQTARAKQFMRVHHNLEVVHGQNEVLRTSGVIKGPDSPTSSTPKELLEASERLETATKNYEETANRLTSDILEHGPMGQMVRELSVAVLGILPKVEEKLKLFEHVLTSPSHTGAGEDLAQYSQLKTVATPIDTAGLARSVGRYFHDDHNTGSVGGMLNAVYRALADMTTEGGEDRPGIDQVVAIVSDPKGQFAAPFVVVPDQAARQLEAMEHRLRRLQSIEPSNQATDKIRAAFQEAISSVTDDIQGLRSYFLAVRLCISAQERLLHDALAYETALFELNRIRASLSKNSEAIEAVNKAIDVISSRARQSGGV